VQNLHQDRGKTKVGREKKTPKRRRKGKKTDALTFGSGHG
jgi:hypothetical protein